MSRPKTRDEILKIYVAILHKASTDMGFSTISQYTLNQIVMAYKQAFNPPELPSELQAKIQQHNSKEIVNKYIGENPFKSQPLSAPKKRRTESIVEYLAKNPVNNETVAQKKDNNIVSLKEWAQQKKEKNNDN